MSVKKSFDLFYDRFDNKTLKFDTERFQFKSWVENELKSIGVDFQKLELLHESMSAKDCASVTKQIIQNTRKKSFLKIAIPFIEECILPLVDNSEVALQRFFNFRILLPDQPLSIVPFHNGQLQGHGLGERTIWMPMTESRDTSSLYLMPVESSRVALKKVRELKSSYRDFQKLLKEEAAPVNIGYGNASLFTQENIHGSLSNITGRTRVSFDFRILIKGLPYGQKIPGGYFSPMYLTEKAL